jgi:hypothetical protein
MPATIRWHNKHIEISHISHHKTVIDANPLKQQRRTKDRRNFNPAGARSLKRKGQPQGLPLH